MDYLKSGSVIKASLALLLLCTLSYHLMLSATLGLCRVPISKEDLTKCGSHLRLGLSSLQNCKK
jgi:hypothetical protein